MLTTILKAAPIVLCSIMFIQCGNPNSHPTKGLAGKDSVSTTDSLSSQASPAQPVSLTYEQQQGKMLYTKYCAICHGDQGKGDGFNAYNLDPKPRDFTDPRAMAGIDDATMLATITEGGKGVNKSPLMPAWGGRMNKLEIEYVIEYVKALEQQH
jgi:mono/diheme cytochrome c family protein